MQSLENPICKLFGIRYPIIQGGMIWCASWELASAVSNAGGLGLIGAGSMYPDVLEKHINRCKAATNKTFGVNLPLMYPHVSEHIEIILKQRVPVVFTSAGSPKKYTGMFQKNGIRVAHVVPGLRFALKAYDAGVDAVVAEGFEAGGHNGIEETTTFCLIPMIKRALDCPLIAAGGIGSGSAILSAMALGADGVQIGSLFAASEESSADMAFKQAIVAAKEGDTRLMLKQIAPVRLLKNDFYQQLEEAEKNGVSREELSELLGKGRARRGMFEGEMKEGELEIGQVSACIDEILPVHKIMEQLIKEYKMVHQSLSTALKYKMDDSV